MRVLGIDPGLSRCGLGLVDGPTHRPVPVSLGVVRTPAEASTADRLAEIYDGVRGVLAEAHVDAVAVERTFLNSNVGTAMGVGQAAGVVLLAAARAGVPVVEYTPTQVKAAVAGHGNAGKAEVTAMVRALLRLAEPPRPADAADALALALCHLQHAHALGGQAMSSRLADAAARARPGAQVTSPARRTGPETGANAEDPR